MLKFKPHPCHKDDLIAEGYMIMLFSTGKYAVFSTNPSSYGESLGQFDTLKQAKKTCEKHNSMRP